MRLVVDANIMIAALIREGYTHLLFFQDGVELFSPEFIFEEFEEHKEEIVSKSGKNAVEFDAVFERLKASMAVVPASVFGHFYEEAEKISPDFDDVEYFALALHLGEDAAIWTNDGALKGQSKVKIYSTSELLEIINIKKM